MTDWSEGPREHRGEDDPSATQPAPPSRSESHTAPTSGDIPNSLVDYEATPVPGKELRDEANGLRKLATEWQEDKLDDTADLWQAADAKDKEAEKIENLVHDPNKARTMADEENKDRTKAVKWRTAANTLEKLPQELEQISQQLVEKGNAPQVTALFGKKKEEQHRQRQDHIEQKEELLRKRVSILGDGERVALDHELHDHMFSASEALRTAVESMGDERAQARHMRFLEEMRERASSADLRAAAVGEWAGVLHDHKPGEVFLATVSSLYNLREPYELYTLEHQTLDDYSEIIKRGEEEIANIEKDGFEELHLAEEVIDEISDNYGHFEDIDGRLTLHNVESRQLVIELKDLVTTAYDDHMTVAAIKERAAAAVKKMLEIEQADLAGYKRVLEDIRSGKAADPNYAVAVPAENPSVQTQETAGQSQEHWQADQAHMWSN